MLTSQEKELKKTVFEFGGEKGDKIPLISAIWRRILDFSKSSDIDDIEGFYESLASELVNDPESRFYLYG